jgi:hypothetical protein
MSSTIGVVRAQEWERISVPYELAYGAFHGMNRTTPCYIANRGLYYTSWDEFWVLVYGSLWTTGECL